MTTHAIDCDLDEDCSCEVAPIRPMFSFFGAKHRIAPLYPAPMHDAIVEPFAGSAAYASRYPDRRVTLVERDPQIAGVWRWLVGASRADVLALPLLPFGTHVDTLPVCQEARWLIGFWLNHATTAPRKTHTRFARVKPGNYWGEAVRARLAAQVERIRHWRVIEGGYEEAPDGPATYFVDPPYVGQARASKYGASTGVMTRPVGDRYRFGTRTIDYSALGEWCRSRTGQVIACENYGATWLPFRPFVNAKSLRHGASREVIWTSDRPRASQLPLVAA